MASQPYTAVHLRAPLAILFAALIGMVPVIVCVLASNSEPIAQVAL